MTFTGFCNPDSPSCLTSLPLPCYRYVCPTHPSYYHPMYPQHNIQLIPHSIVTTTPPPLPKAQSPENSPNYKMVVIVGTYTFYARGIKSQTVGTLSKKLWKWSNWDGSWKQSRSISYGEITQNTKGKYLAQCHMHSSTNEGYSDLSLDCGNSLVLKMTVGHMPHMRFMS